MAAVADDVALANLLGGPSVVAADGAAAKNAANVQNWRDDACVNELLQQPPLQIEKLLQQAGHLRQQPELASFEDPFDQSRDVATLLAAMEPTPTWSAGGASRRRPAIAESQQRRRDDNVLSQILFGESPSASPVNVARDDAALAGALSLPGSRAVVKDDAVLAKLLSMEEEKQVVLQTPLLEIVEGLARDVRQALAKAEVVAGGHGRGDKLCQLSRPMGLAVDASGAVVVADNGNGRLVRWRWTALGICSRQLAGRCCESWGRNPTSSPAATGRRALPWRAAAPSSLLTPSTTAWFVASGLGAPCRARSWLVAMAPAAAVTSCTGRSVLRLTEPAPFSSWIAVTTVWFGGLPAPVRGRLWLEGTAKVVDWNS
eukprot:TRINITY_DN27255_c0_g1_i3.p1 TRINITY_DN27255_c0_g1~~TRINITY_DN27255_c0_g1_i3.p1  ORF type:complete len:418 (-),score=74.90 TRINITY_DN27255_c0_g1_i3:351-1469(-)